MQEAEEEREQAVKKKKMDFGEKSVGSAVRRRGVERKVGRRATMTLTLRDSRRRVGRNEEGNDSNVGIAKIVLVLLCTLLKASPLNLGQRLETKRKCLQRRQNEKTNTLLTIQQRLSRLDHVSRLDRNGRHRLPDQPPADLDHDLGLHRFELDGDGVRLQDVADCDGDRSNGGEDGRLERGTRSYVRNGKGVSTGVEKRRKGREAEP